MLTILAHGRDTGFNELASVEETRRALRDDAALVWIDFDVPSDESAALLSILELHPLVVEAIEEGGHGPRLDDHERHLLAIVHARAPGRTTELAVVLGRSFVVTRHATAFEPIDRLRDAARTVMADGAGGLLREILRAVVATFDHTWRPEPALRRARRLNRERRVASRMREVVERLTTPHPVIALETRRSLRHVQERLDALVARLEDEQDDAERDLRYLIDVGASWVSSKGTSSRT